MTPKEIYLNFWGTNNVAELNVGLRLGIANGKISIL